jgi:hypothetical protein
MEVEEKDWMTLTFDPNSRKLEPNRQMNPFYFIVSSNGFQNCEPFAGSKHFNKSHQNRGNAEIRGVEVQAATTKQISQRSARVGWP